MMKSTKKKRSIDTSTGAEISVEDACQNISTECFQKDTNPGSSERFEAVSSKQEIEKAHYSDFEGHKTPVKYNIPKKNASSESKVKYPSMLKSTSIRKRKRSSHSLGDGDNLTCLETDAVMAHVPVLMKSYSSESSKDVENMADMPVLMPSYSLDSSENVEAMADMPVLMSSCSSETSKNVEPMADIPVLLPSCSSDKPANVEPIADIPVLMPSCSSETSTNVEPISPISDIPVLIPSSLSETSQNIEPSTSYVGRNQPSGPSSSHALFIPDLPPTYHSFRHGISDTKSPNCELNLTRKSDSSSNKSSEHELSFEYDTDVIANVQPSTSRVITIGKAIKKASDKKMFKNIQKMLNYMPPPHSNPQSEFDNDPDVYPNPDGYQDPDVYQGSEKYPYDLGSNTDPYDDLEDCGRHDNLAESHTKKHDSEEILSDTDS